MTAAVDQARGRLQAGKTAPAKPPWHPPGWDDFFQHRVIIAFDASLVNTGWIALRAWLAGVDVIGHGTIRPVTEETGYMATLSLGESYADEARNEEYLSVDRSDVGGSAVRSYGTLASPGSTVRLW